MCTQCFTATSRDGLPLPFSRVEPIFPLAIELQAVDERVRREPRRAVPGWSSRPMDRAQKPRASILYHTITEV